MARVFGVLEVTQFGRGGELGVVLIGDAGLRQRRLQADRVGPRVFGTADSATLADIEQQADIRLRQRVGELAEPPAVDADSDHTLHDDRDSGAR